MHTEKVPEILKEIKNLPQSSKWLQAMCKAPSWQKEVYAAQSVAWLEEELESWHDWCNPLARA